MDLYTAILLCGAIGSGETSACIRLFARQLLSCQAENSKTHPVSSWKSTAIVCEQVRDILEDAGCGED